MNSSFEQFFKKPNNQKADNLKYGNNGMPSIKKQQKTNSTNKNNNSLYTQSKYHIQSYNSSLISNDSLQKNMTKVNTTKSNQKKSKREDTFKQRNQTANPFKKNLTLQLTKKQKQIREAIQYRFQKSKIRNYQFSCMQSKNNQFQDSKVRQIIDLQEEQNFAQLYGYLSTIKVINLYEYTKFKDEIMQTKKQKSNNKIIVIKNSKKKRQNSDTVISFHNKNSDQENNNHRLVLNTNVGNYFSGNPINIQSQRNHTQISTNHHRNKSQSPSQNFKLQFPSSKVFEKQRNQSKEKLKTQNSLGNNEKIHFSSSVQKNFKSIKDIYLNAITNLANKNTMKSNNKLFKSQNQIKNKSSKSFIYQSEKKSYKKQLKNGFKNQINLKSSQNKNKKDKANLKSNQNSRNNEYSKLNQNIRINDELKLKNNSNSALYQNYFSCISSRDNRNQDKNSSSLNQRKPTKQKLDKTVLINESNPSQWKSVIMKIEDPYKQITKNQLLKEAIQYENQSKRLKLKKKQEQFNSKLNKNFLNSAQGKFTGYPHSYREYIKSPKFKRFILNQDDQNTQIGRNQGKRHVNSVKNLSNQSFQTLINSSKISMNQGVNFGKKQRK